MKRITSILAALLIALSLRVVQAEAVEKRMTLMIYMCGSTLESNNGSASLDIEEIKESGADLAALNVVVMTGGARYWQNGQDANRIVINKLSRRGILSVWNDDTRSMGETDTLRDFLNYAVEQFPAKDYALILWNHGGGPMEGVCLDENYDPDRLDLQELVDALKESPFSEKKLEWIGFDACLMGSTEVALQLAPYARYMICSEETEPKEGWDYLFLKGLSEDVDGAATGKRIVDTYMDTAADGPMTLSCVDLSRMEAVRNSVDALFSLWEGRVDEKTYSEIAKRRKAIVGYGMDVGRSMRDHDLIDLGYLVSTMEEMDSTAGEEVLKAVLEAVVYERSNLNDSCGMTVYFPYYNKDRYEKVWKNAYANFKSMPSYTRFIERFGEVLTGEALADWRNLPLGVYVASQRDTLSNTFSYENMIDRLMLNPIMDSEIITPEDQNTIDSGILVKTRLSDDQMEAFASARLVVMERFRTMLNSRTQYRVVYTSPELPMEPDGTIRTGYQLQTLHAVNSQGKSLASDISYNTLDNGEIAVHMLARNDLHTDAGDAEELRLIMTLRVDGDSRIRRTGIYVYDALTDTYLRRAAYDATRYPYISFPARYMTLSPDDGAEATDSVEWEDSGNYGRDAVIRYSDDWHFEFQTTFETRTLVMCLEITDTQNNRHLTEMRMITAGNLSPDMLYESFYFRVLADNIQISASQIDLLLTFIANEGEDFEVYLCDPAVNGVRTSFLDAVGSGDFARVHVRADGAQTQTLSLRTVENEQVREVSLRFMLDVDHDRKFAEDNSDEGYAVESYYSNPSGGSEWVCSTRTKLRLKEAILPTEQPTLLTSGDFTVLGGILTPQGERHDPAVADVSPLNTSARDIFMYGTSEVAVPPEAEGYAHAYLIAGTREGDMLQVSRLVMDYMSMPMNNALYFIHPINNVSLTTGTADLPLILGLGTNASGQIMLNIQNTISLWAGNSENRISHVLFAPNGTTTLRWEDGEWPVELSDTVTVDTYSVPLKEGAALRLSWMKRQKAAIDVLPLRLRTTYAATDSKFVFFVDEDGMILSIQELTGGETLTAIVGGVLSDDGDPVIEVEHILSDGKTVQRLYQYRDWIGWEMDEGGICISSYLGSETKVEVPAEIGGVPIREIARDAFNHSGITDLVLPDSVNRVSVDCFNEASGDVCTPYRDTLTLSIPLKALSLGERDFADIMTAIEQWGFRRILFTDTELLWVPPMVYRHLPSGDWEVMGCNNGFQSIVVPAEMEGGKVTAIGDNAFRRSALDFVRAVEVSEGVETIGAKALARSSLTSITLPASISHIESDAFEDCGMLMSADIRCSNSALPDNLFARCPLLVMDPGGVKLSTGVDAVRLGLPDDLGAADGGDVFSASKYMGLWEYERERIAGEGWMANCVLFDIALYENGTYNGIYFNPVAGQWTVYAGAILTEHFVLIPEGDNLVVYTNARRMVCHRGAATDTPFLRPSWNVHIS